MGPESSFATCRGIAFFAPGIAEGLRRYPELVNPLLIAGQLFAFRPAEALWDKPFPDWTEPDWAHHDNLSLLWLIGEARVIGLPGLASLGEVRSRNVAFKNLQRTGG